MRQRLLHAVPVLVASAVTLLAAPAFAKTIAVRPGDSIQDAVDTANPGDKILLRRGVHTERGVSVKKDRIRFVGQRAVWDGGPRDGFVLDASGDDIQVSGITFRNGGAQLFILGARAKVRGCVFRSSGSTGLGIDGDDALVDRCRFRWNLGNAIRIQGDGAMVKRCDARQVLGEVDSDEHTTFHIRGVGADVMRNTIRNVDERGITVWAQPSAGKVGDGANILNNRITNAGNIGIHVGTDTVDLRVDEALIRGNRVIACDDDAILVQGDGAQIDRNVVRLGNDDGIDVRGDGAVVTNNTVTDFTDDDGIGVEGDGGKITNNVIANVSDKGIRYRGDDFEICRNRIRDVIENDGIAVENEDHPEGLANDGLIEGNTIIDCGGEGLELNMSNSTIRRNTIRGCGSNCTDEGIDLFGDGNVVDRNTVIDSTGSGFVLEGDRNVLTFGSRSASAASTASGSRTPSTPT